MRIPPRLAAVVATCALALTATAAPASSAVTAASARGSDVVGGPRLAGPGLVVEPGTRPLPQVAAASWLVADLESGEVLAARDPHGRYAPASTLKTLTALALIPVLPADRLVRPTYDDVAVEGSKVGLVEQVEYPVHELFASLLMVSGNDSANALASAAGGQARTAQLMNETAASLKALDTRAVNPHGLDAPGQVSSAYDLALIARAGLGDPDFARYVSTVSSSVSAPAGARIAMRNKNKLLTGYEGALGVKNGYTSAARASFVGAAERDGRRLVVTLMKADPRVFDEAAKLLDWGFATPVRPVGQLVEPVEPVVVEEPAVRSAGGVRGGTSSAATGPLGAGSPRPAPADGTGLPVTLAGMSLAAAALLAVRRRPAPAVRTARRPPARRPAPPGRTSRGAPARTARPAPRQGRRVERGRVERGR